MSEHPTVAVTKLASECDAIIVDDRFINQNESIQREAGGSTPVFTTLDLLSTLRSNDLINSEVFSEHLTLLRRAGYMFVAISEMELSNQIGICSRENWTARGDCGIESHEGQYLVRADG